MRMKLLERCKIGTLNLKNRISFPPVTTGFGAENGCFGQDETDFAVERAKGGAAMIFSDAVCINRHHQLFVSTPLPYFDNDEQITKYSRFVDAIHHHGALTCIQLYHAGRQTSFAKRGGGLPVAPSEFSTMMLERLPFPDAIEMSVVDIERVINEFGLAASRAKNAGFDAVDIDGGAGYLIQQFMSPLTNKRNDCWGGSLENRMRFPLEIIKRMRELLGSDYPLIFDLCLDEMVDGGITPDQGCEMAVILESAGIDAFRIHGVNIETYQHMFPGTGSPVASNIPLGRMLKSRLKTAKVMLGKRINDPELAEQVLEKGAADIILLARPLIADPYFPKKVYRGNPQSIRKCIACNVCADNLGYAKPIRCALNPVVGFEREYAHLPVTNAPKKILVIGGGVAGLEAAMVSAEKGHQVILAEKSNILGGQINYAAATPHKEEFSNILSFYEHQFKDLNIDVRLNLEVDRQTVLDIKPDIVILATGATPLKPKITGIEKSCVVMAEDVLKNPDICEEGPIAIVGGGALGAEIAELYAMKGRDVRIIEMKKSIAEDMGILVALAFHERFNKLNIEKITNATVSRIEDGRVYYSINGNEERYTDASWVVIAAGYQSNRVLEDELLDLVDEVITIGDCQSPRKILNAIHEGFHAARMID